MNRRIITKVASAFLLTLVLASGANAGDGLRFGGRLAGGIIQMYDGGGRVYDDLSDPDFYLGYGWELGLVIERPIINRLSLIAEVNLFYREMGSFKYTYYFDEYGYDYIEAEVADLETGILIPVMARYSPTERIFLSAGLQLGIPFRSIARNSVTMVEDWGFEIFRDEMYYSDVNASRLFVDGGVVAEIGYMITPKLGASFRFVYNWDPIYGDWGGIYHNNFSLGITYFP